MANEDDATVGKEFSLTLGEAGYIASIIEKQAVLEQQRNALARAMNAISNEFTDRVGLPKGTKLELLEGGKRVKVVGPPDPAPEQATTAPQAAK